MTIIYLLLFIILQVFQVNGETVNGYYGQALQTRNYEAFLLQVNWSDAFELCRFYGLELYNTIQSSSFKNILFYNRIYLKNQLWPVGQHIWVGVVSNTTMALMVDSPSSCKEITDSIRVFDLNLPLGTQQCLALNMSGSMYEDLLFWTRCSDLNGFLCQCLTYGNVTVEEFKERQLLINSFDSSNLPLMERFSDENKENCSKRVQLQLDVFASDYNFNTSVCSTYRLGNLNVPVNILPFLSDVHTTFVKTEGIDVTVKQTSPDFKISTSFAEKCLTFNSVSSSKDVLQKEQRMTTTVYATTVTTLTRSAPIVPEATEALTTTQATTAGATTMGTTLIVQAKTEALTTTQATTAVATTMETTLKVPATAEAPTTTQATTAGAATMETTLIVPATTVAPKTTEATTAGATTKTTTLKVPATTEAPTTTQATTAGARIMATILKVPVTTEAPTTTQATTAGATTMGTTPIVPATAEVPPTAETTATRTAPTPTTFVGKLSTVAATKTDAITEIACATTIICACSSAPIDLVKVIQEAEKLSLSLKINITNLSSYKRRHASVSDSRRSATIIGVLGGCVLTAIVGIIIVPDFIRLIA